MCRSKMMTGHFFYLFLIKGVAHSFKRVANGNFKLPRCRIRVVAMKLFLQPEDLLLKEWNLFF